MASTYSQYQQLEASQKGGLVILEAAKRLVGWELHIGSIYKLTSFPFAVLGNDSPIQMAGVALTDGGSIGGVTAGKYYLDVSAATLYLRTSDSADPNTKYISCVGRFFFSRDGVALPYDLASGRDVYWHPMLLETSEFGSELDNQRQFGIALEGGGSVTFANDQDFWKSRFDRFYFESQLCLVYSWTPGLPASQAKLIWKGPITAKTYSPTKVSFSISDSFNVLRSQVPIETLNDYSGTALVPDSWLQYPMRKIYGWVFGHRPLNIDQVVDGYALTGTFSLTNGSASVTASSSTMLAKLSPDDRILFSVDTDPVTVASISSNTAFTLSEVYAGTTGAAKTAVIIPSHPKRYINRVFLVAGHATSEPSVTLNANCTTRIMRFAENTDFVAQLRVGDAVYVSSQLAEIESISSTSIRITTALTLPPSAGATLIRPSVSSVYLNGSAMRYGRDYTYNPTTAVLTLDDEAEFNIAPISQIQGTLSITNGLRAVTGSGTAFREQVQPGDWIRFAGFATWSEVLQVNSDTSLDVRVAWPNSTASSVAATIKKLNVYEEGSSVLTCDVLGAVNSGGYLLKTVPEIVEDLLTDAGLTDALNTASFTQSKLMTSARVGIVLPSSYTDKKPPILRDVVQKLNLSDFYHLVLNADFEIEYNLLSPARDDTAMELKEQDILSLTIENMKDKIIKTARVTYRPQESDRIGNESRQIVSKVSDDARYLAESIEELVVDTNLVDEQNAQIYANRWAFLKERASNLLKVETKLRASQLKIGDRVVVNHQKLYERYGSASGTQRKIAMVTSIKRTLRGCVLVLDDLSNAFTRCAVFTGASPTAFESATDAQKSVSSYFTDSNGMIDNDPETFGTNTFW